jgi:hypothetical protein
MPVRSMIHSSDVLTSCASSSLVTTLSGTAKPVPRNRVLGINDPTVGVRKKVYELS